MGKWDLSLYNKKIKWERSASSLKIGNSVWVSSVKGKKYSTFSSSSQNERESDSKWVMCSAFLHISFKAHSSGKLLKQNKPIRKLLMFSNAPYNPWNIYPAIPDQRHCSIKSKGGLQKPGEGYKGYREWRSQTKPVQSWTLHERKPEAACAYTTHGWQSHQEPWQPPEPRSSKARAQWCKGTGMQTPAGPGPALSTQRTEHLHRQHASEHWELDHPQVYSCIFKCPIPSNPKINYNSIPEQMTASS